MIRAVVFDLDDTLYPELDYVHSGLWAVAEYVQQHWCVRKEEFYDTEQQLLQQYGRGKIFDLALERHRLSEQVDVRQLVDVYRSHVPNGLKLYGDVPPLLKQLKHRRIKTGMITDGCARVQWAKVRALQLEQQVDLVVVTDDWGVAYWKPHERAYRMLMDVWRLDGPDCCYVGDNPHKDFIAARRLSWRTVRVRRQQGAHIAVHADADHEADVVVPDLAELLEKLGND